MSEFIAISVCVVNVRILMCAYEYSYHCKHSTAVSLLSLTHDAHIQVWSTNSKFHRETLNSSRTRVGCTSLRTVRKDWKCFSRGDTWSQTLVVPMFSRSGKLYLVSPMTSVLVLMEISLFFYMIVPSSCLPGWTVIYIYLCTKMVWPKTFSLNLLTMTLSVRWPKRHFVMGFRAR